MGAEQDVQKYMDLQQLQQLQDNFSLAVGISTVILNKKGEALTQPSRPAHTAAKQKSVQSPFWESAAFTGLRSKAEKEQVPASTVLEDGSQALIVPLLLDEDYLGCWAVHLPPAAPAKAAGQAPPAPEARTATIINALSAMDDIAARLFLRNKRLQRVIHNFNAQNRQLQAFVDASETAMYVSDYHTGELLMVNQAFCRQEGVNADMVLGGKCWKVIHNSKNGVCSFCPRGNLIDSHDTPSGVHVWEHFNQRLGRWMKCTNKAFYWTGDRLAHMVTIVDITKERQLRESLMHAAYYDRHTGLANIEKLYIDLREMQTDLRTDSVHLVCLQLKSINQFNRIYGKKNGYHLCSSMGDWLQSLDDNAQVYRTENYGFILMLPNCSLKKCKSLARDIRARFDEAWQLDIDGHPVFHYCSISGSIICLSNSFYQQNIDDLVERTLQSAVEAKDFFIYDENIDLQAKRRVEFEIALKNHVRNNMLGFAVHYQPIVNARSGVWHGLEALCRWTNKSTGEAVSPAQFIPEAERLGLIGEIGEWVLEQSVRLCKELHLDEIDTFFLSVNMSFAQIMDEGFVERVAHILDTHHYPPSKLDLEVTESMEFHFDSFTLSTIERFKKLGISLALDDFGTGYASFHQLKNLPAKYVKTERNFALGLEHDQHMQYFYYIISELAHMNGMQLIAEGIENREQLELVRKNGADLIQGYYFSRPLPKEKLADCIVRFSQAEPGKDLVHLPAGSTLHWMSQKCLQSVPPQLSQLMNQCIGLLLSQQAMEPMLRNMLKAVGQHFGLACTFTFIYGQKAAECQAFGWEGQDGQASWQHLSKHAVQQVKPYLHEAFAESGALITSDISALPPAIFDLLSPAGLRSIMVVPLHQDNKVLGLVGYGDAQHRNWDQNELTMLYNLSRIFSGVLEHARFKRDNRVQWENNRAVHLDYLGAAPEHKIASNQNAGNLKAGKTLGGKS